MIDSFSKYFNPSLPINQIQQGLVNFAKLKDKDEETYDFARQLFTGTIGLRNASRNLQNIRSKILEEKRPALIQAFNEAVKVFNRLGLKEAVAEIEESDLTAPAKPAADAERSQSLQADFPEVVFLNIDQRESNKIIFGYLSPNEFTPSLFADALSRAGGTLLSVGTFRALINFTNGTCDTAMLIDFDPNVCIFNHLHLQIIGRIGAIESLTPAEQRELYMTVMRDYQDNKEKFQNLPSDIQEILQDIVDIGIDHLGRLSWVSEIFHTLDNYQTASPPFGYFWEEDEKWNLLVKAIWEGRLAVVQGDLVNGKALTILGSLASANQQQVGIVDISNIPSYLDQQAGAKLIDNLKQLPFTEHGAILYTTRKGDNLSSSVGEADWGYHALPAGKVEEVKEACNAPSLDVNIV